MWRNVQTLVLTNLLMATPYESPLQCNRSYFSLTKVTKNISYLMVGFPKDTYYDYRLKKGKILAFSPKIKSRKSNVQSFGIPFTAQFSRHSFGQINNSKIDSDIHDIPSCSHQDSRPSEPLKHLNIQKSIRHKFINKRPWIRKSDCMNSHTRSIFPCWHNTLFAGKYLKFRE